MHSYAPDIRCFFWCHLFFRTVIFVCFAVHLYTRFIMWRQLCSTLDILCRTTVSQQYISHKHCNGLVCRHEHGFGRGTVLAVIPFTYCASPAIARASPWGKRLESALRHDYSCRSDTMHVAYSHANALTTAFTALAMQPHSPIANYLSYIDDSSTSPESEAPSSANAADELPRWMMSPSVESALEELSCCPLSAGATSLSCHADGTASGPLCDDRGTCAESTGAAAAAHSTARSSTAASCIHGINKTLFRERMRAVCELTTRVLEAVAHDMSSSNLSVGMDALQRAHYLCSSRAVVFPDCEEVLGGAALVPFVDLINHDDGPDNVSISLLTAATTQKLLRRKASCGDDDVIQPDRLHSKCPFFVVVQARDDIAAGEELVYSYIDRESDDALYRQPLFWATRFGFIPPSVIARCTAQQATADTSPVLSHA